MNPISRSECFKRCRESVTAKEAARYYGLDIRSNNTACCPFHADDKPSMSFKNGFFHCFGCGAHGDSIDYVAMYFGLNPLDAVIKLNRDFALQLPIDRPPTADERKAAYKRAIAEAEKREFEEWREYTLNLLTYIYRTGHLALMSGRELTDAEALAVRLMDRIEYLLEEVVM